MFSPRAGEGPASSTRSRRRHRTSDTVPQPKAKRQRPNDVSRPDQPEMEEVRGLASRLDTRQNGIEASLVVASGVPRKDLTVRSKKAKPVDRSSKGDGSVVLASNSAFVVTKLPALPEKMRNHIGPQHGELDAHSGFGVNLTHTHALVWPYASASASPETFVFALPYPSKHPTDPLPLGCLVLPSASSSEPGLVVVMPLTGRITYWESILTAATLDFMKQERNGVESSVQGMFSGERVVQIVNAESAGFILTFTSGRVAYMSLRDSHGRPTITTQFLSTGVAGSVGGLFGTLRHALSASPARGDLAAVRAAASHRIGERDVVVLTVRGRLEAWRVHRGGHYEALAEADIRADIISALRSNDPEIYDYPEDSFEAIDLAVVPRGLDPRYLDMTRLSDAIALDDPSIQHVLMLVSLTKRRVTRYALVEVVATSRHSCQIGMVRPIVSYSVPCDHAAAVRPRLYLPRPALVAFVVFERAIVVASIAEPPQSPESQLEEDSHVLPATYEDVIDLRDDDDVLAIVGSGCEEPPPLFAANDGNSNHSPISPTTNTAPSTTTTHRQRTKNPSVLVMARSSGILRVSTTDVDKFADQAPPRVTAKSRLEQAVFFGVKPDNPLVFDRRPVAAISFTNDEFADAALELSAEILSSSSPFMSTLPVSIEDNLGGRLQALEKLVGHLKLMGVRLNRRARWTLLFHAQKMAVARLLWKRHEHFTDVRPANDKTTLIGHVVAFIHENQKTVPNTARGEVDPVRHWFVNDVASLDVLVAWCYEVIKHLSRESCFDPARLTVLLHEAVNVSVCAMLAGLEFRKRSMSLYGLEDEDVEFGILRSGYEDLPEPWTASTVVVTRVKRLIDLCEKWIKKYDATTAQEGADPVPDAQALDDILKEMPQISDLYLVSLLEATRYHSALSDEASQKMAVDLQRAYDSEREAKPVELANLELFAEAAMVAEKHRSWSALALVLVDHIHYLVRIAGETNPATSPEMVASLEAEISDERKRVARMLDKHGQPFAFALYDVMLAKEGIKAVLEYEDDRHGYKTRFLRSKPELARVSWIHDIEEERDIGHAADTLLSLSLNGESRVWAKKIELSLGKLALLAQAERPSTARTGLFALQPARTAATAPDDRIEMVDRQLGLVSVQDRLHAHVRSAVSNAIDEIAELELAMGAFAQNLPKKHKVLREMFEDALTRLLAHEVLDPMTLIDLLTLMTPVSSEDVEVGLQDQFFLALEAARFGLGSGEEYDTAARLIWRRCFIRDEWAKINDTNMRADHDVTMRLASTALFTAYYACLESDSPPTHFPAPADVLSVFSDSLDNRFADADKGFCDQIMAAMRVEDATLRKYIQNYRLADWAIAAVDKARRAWEQVTDERTREDVLGGGVGSMLSGSMSGGGLDEDVDEVDLVPSNGLVTPPSGSEGRKRRKR